MKKEKKRTTDCNVNVEVKEEEGVAEEEEEVRGQAGKFPSVQSGWG